MLAPGSSFSTIGRMVAAPSTSVSSRPRRLSMRSVKTWPRSRSAPSWISSMARKATSRSRGIASTVDDPEARVRRLDLLLAGDERDVRPRRPGRRPCCRPRAPAAAAAARSCRTNAPSMRSMARWVLPVLVGPSTAVTPAPRARRVAGDGRRERNGHQGSGFAVDLDTGTAWRRDRLASDLRRGRPTAIASVSQCDACRRDGAPVLKLWNESGTKSRPNR